MNSIQAEILQDIKSAKRIIKVAVSWLRDYELLDALINASKNDITVNVVLSCAVENIALHKQISALVQAGAMVRKWGSQSALDGGFMHYKFYIIDDETAKSGSYNWTFNAKTNKEALDVVSLGNKMNQFNELWSESIDYFTPISYPKSQPEFIIDDKSIEDFNKSCTEVVKTSNTCYFSINHSAKDLKNFFSLWVDIIVYGDANSKDAIGDLLNSDFQPKISVPPDILLNDFLAELPKGIIISERAYFLFVEPYTNLYQSKKIVIFQSGALSAYYLVKIHHKNNELNLLSCLDVAKSRFIESDTDSKLLTFKDKKSLGHFYFSRKFKAEFKGDKSYLLKPATLMFDSSNIHYPLINFWGRVLFRNDIVSLIKENELIGFSFFEQCPPKF